MKFSMFLLITLFAQPWGQRMYYNLNSLKTVEGVVITVQKQEWPVRMNIMSLQEDTLEVILGPPFGLPWIPNMGDTVVVFGSIYKNIIIAGTIYDKNLEKKLILRDENGFPVWRGRGYKLRRGHRGRR